MKNVLMTICITWLLLMGQPGAVFADYVMMCTFFQNPEARVYKVSDEGNITLDYTLTVGGYPLSIEFAPNGRWGLVGGNTGYPERYKTIVLGVDEHRQISVLGTVHNEYYELVAISPDSHYGVYGWPLQTLKFLPDENFEVIPTNNPPLCDQATFSKLSNNIIGQRRQTIEEFILLPNGRTTSTGLVIDISPSTGWQDIEVSPDGRTCIVLSIGKYEFTVLQVHRQGGFSLVQQFETPSLNAWDVCFTPDSKYAVISFNDHSNNPDLRSYFIDVDSKLSEVDGINVCNNIATMSVTPDGRFAVSIALYQSNSHFYVTRIHDDGTLEYLPDKDYVCNGHVSAIAFVPPYKTAASTSWTMYE